MNRFLSFPTRTILGQRVEVDATALLAMRALASNRWRATCLDKYGRIRWVDEWTNLVVTAGKNKLLDATFKTGLASPAWYVGLKGAGTVSAADTMGSHAGWTDVDCYSQANRPAWTPGTISGGSVDNSASKAVFTIDVDSTAAGGFLADNNTVSGTTGTLYGAGDFAASRAVYIGDTLNVTVTPSIT